MDHERDELLERRKAKLSSAGREVLAELEALERVLEAPSEEMMGRIVTLPPSDRAELSAIFGGMAQDYAARQRENMGNAAQAGSFMEIIQEAQERQRAAGRPVDPNMTVGDALEILGR